MKVNSKLADRIIGNAVGEITRVVRGRISCPGTACRPRRRWPRICVCRARWCARRSTRSRRCASSSCDRQARDSGADRPRAMSLVIERGVHTGQINIQQIYDVRRTMETQIVTLTTLRRTDEEAREILDEARAMRAGLADPEALMRHDLAFHRHWRGPRRTQSSGSSSGPSRGSRRRPGRSAGRAGRRRKRARR